MIGVADFRHCSKCKRITPHSRKGDCKQCVALRRRAARISRRSVVGSPLVAYGQLLDVADKLWSIWLRAFWDGCEMCYAPLHPSHLQCMHGFSRQERMLRFSVDNTFAGCAACHRRNTPPRADWWDWMRERLAARLRAGIGQGGPDPFARLELASKARGGRLTGYALHGVIADAQARIAALPDGPRKEWALEMAAKATLPLSRLVA